MSDQARIWRRFAGRCTLS